MKKIFIFAVSLIFIVGNIYGDNVKEKDTFDSRFDIMWLDQDLGSIGFKNQHGFSFSKKNNKGEKINGIIDRNGKIIFQSSKYRVILINTKEKYFIIEKNKNDSKNLDKKSIALSDYQNKIWNNTFFYKLSVSQNGLILFKLEEDKPWYLAKFDGVILREYPAQLKNLNFTSKPLVLSCNLSSKTGLKEGFVDVDGNTIQENYSLEVKNFEKSGYQICRLKDDFIRIYKDKSFGIINNKGKIILPCEFSKLSLDSAGKILGKRNNFTSSLFNYKGEKLKDYNSSNGLIDHINEEFLFAYYDNKPLFLDLDNKPLTPILDSATDFSNGAALIKYNGKYGIIKDKKHHKINLSEPSIISNLKPDAKLKYKSLSDLIASDTSIKIDDKAISLQDLNIQTISEKVYFKEVFNKKKGLFLFAGIKGNEDYVYDKTGKKLSYSSSDISRSDKNIYNKDDKTLAINHYGILNDDAKAITPLNYTYLKKLNYNEDSYIYQIQTPQKLYKSGIINKTGKIICQAKYDQILDNKHGLIVVRMNHKLGLIDAKGKTILETKFKNINLGMGEFISAKEDDKYYVYDKFGKRVGNESAYQISAFNKYNYALKLDNEKYTIIDSKGKIIYKIPKGSKGISLFDNFPILEYDIGSKTYYFDLNNKIGKNITAAYDMGEFLKVVNGKSEEVYDADCNKICTAKNSSIEKLKNGMFLATGDSESSLYTEKGNKILTAKNIRIEDFAINENYAKNKKYYKISTENRKLFGLIDENKIILKPQYKNVGVDNENIYAVLNSDKEEVSKFDLNGKYVAKQSPHMPLAYIRGFGVVIKNTGSVLDTCIIFNKAGKSIFVDTFKQCTPFCEGVCVILFKNQNGEEVYGMLDLKELPLGGK